MSSGTAGPQRCEPAVSHELELEPAVSHELELELELEVEVELPEAA